MGLPELWLKELTWESLPRNPCFAIRQARYRARDPSCPEFRFPYPGSGPPQNRNKPLLGGIVAFLMVILGEILSIVSVLGGGD